MLETKETGRGRGMSSGGSFEAEEQKAVDAVAENRES